MWIVGSLPSWVSMKKASEKQQFEVADKCSVVHLENETVIASLEGTVLLSYSPFAYFFLVGLEAGSPLRALCVLLVWPLVALMDILGFSGMAMRMMILVTFIGLKANEVEIVSRSVLPKFYLEDMSAECYQIFMSCRRRTVATESPSVMVKYSLKEFLGVETVVGTELQVNKNGYFTGLISNKDESVVAAGKAKAIETVLQDVVLDLGLGSCTSDFPFMKLCKRAYMVRNLGKEKVPRDMYKKPLVFHDGRLVQRPTPLMAVTVLLWVPFGVALALFRVAVGATVPAAISVPVEAAMGLKIRVKGGVARMNMDERGILLVCNHRTLLDPVFVSVAWGHEVTAFTYSISPLSEFLSPIKTIRLSRSRSRDAKLLRDALEEKNHVVICPEGTTCREPYLLRFSPLFAEVGELIVPVAVKVGMSMFYGSTARGWKALDSFFFFMNPNPSYEVIFLDPFPPPPPPPAIEVANQLQRMLADCLGYQCTTFTRRDKYAILAGNDGTLQSS